jgi:hypothetical protein
MNATAKAKRSKTLNLAKLFQHLSMLFESPEKKQFRRLKDFIAA